MSTDSSCSGPIAIAIAAVLQKTDPFVLDKTIQSLEVLSPGGVAGTNHCPLPLGSSKSKSKSNSASSSRSHPEDQDRPFLETFFNRIDGNDYKSPWKPSSNDSNSNSNSDSDPEVAELEASAGEVWDAYRQLYYGHDAVGSVFCRRKDNDANANNAGAAASSATPSKKKAGKSAALEALFGIQKVVLGDNNEHEHERNNGAQETARWESVHLVTIEAPNHEAKTCDYKIRSTVWCRYQPPDVGDVPKRVAVPAKKAPAPAKPKPKPTSKALDVKRLELFDKAASNWDSHHSNHSNATPKVPRVVGASPLPPVPATVTSSAVYTMETTKSCTLSAPYHNAGNTASGKSGPPKSTTTAIPSSQHIRNIGTMIEKVEADLRSKLERVDAPRCVEILQNMYRPSLSPGLRLPLPTGGTGSSHNHSGSGMISRLGGHATGMGVGRGLIGEIALKAQLRNATGATPTPTPTTSNSNSNANKPTNKAMESILAAEKKKLRVPTTATQQLPMMGGSNMLELRAGLKKTNSAARVAAAESAVAAQQQQQQPPPAAEFIKFRKNLKPSAKR